MRLSRRRVLQIVGGTSVTVVAGGGATIAWLRSQPNRETELGYAFPQENVGAEVLAATPACGNHALTDAVVEGPFYKPATPLRQVLRGASSIGVPLTIEGRVISPGCRPIAGAILDVWNCDGNGVYDNEGFALRGHQFTDREGRFHIETVKPGDYSTLGPFGRRTPHVHVKVQGRDTRLLTTQLYFPGERLNHRDPWFNQRLLLDVDATADRGLVARFDFVLPARSAV
jgi:protocatechuate 3,4-dioxygenase beta subunit